MAFSQLPPELLAMIASYIMPYDFENLSLTCKKAYEWARPLIPRHNEYRRRWRNFSFESSGLTTIFDLLAVIADDPIIATYMVHVELDGRQCCSEKDMEDADYIERMTKRLAPLVLGSPHLSMLRDEFDDKPAELWLEKIMRDLESYIRKVYYAYAEFGVSFLATLLINVETLTLPEEWCDPYIITNRDSEHKVISLLRLLVKRANDKNLKDQPLQKLRAILPTRDVRLQYGMVMEQLFPFLSLDSLKELHSASGACPFTRGRTAFPTLGRNLEIMKLKHYDISGHSAKVLFKDMHKLRVLEIDYSSRDDMGDAFHADLLMRSVITGACGSLEKLVFTGFALWPGAAVLECSLRELTRLGHLEMSTIFFVNGIGSMNSEDSRFFYEESADEENNEDEESSEDEENIEYEYTTEDDEDSLDQEETSDEKGGEYMIAHKAKGAIPEGTMHTTHGVRRLKPLLGDQFHPDDEPKMGKYRERVWYLVSVLPESLETLIIHTPAEPQNSACVERMFWRFEELRAQRLPNLKQIEVHLHKGYLSRNRIADYSRQTRRLQRFFADKKILTKFQECN